MKQTAVEWLQEAISKKVNNELGPYFIDLFDKAKAMEKQEIIDAWDKRCTEGTFIGGWHIETKSGEEYYNEQFKNK